MNTTVLITGASGGIGKQIAYEFARQGFAIIGTYRKDGEQAEVVKKECLERGAARVDFLNLDLTQDESIENAAKLVANYGGIDILINNAGVLVQSILKDQSLEEIAAQIRTNLEGPIKFTARCLPNIRSCIINIGSTSSLVTQRELAVYCASKFGLRGFTKALAKENPQLLVLALHPGLTATTMGKLRGDDPEVVARVIYNFASRQARAKSGADIWIRDYLPGAWLKPKRLLHRLIFKYFGFLVG